MDGAAEKLLLGAAVRLDALQSRGRIRQNVGSIPNTMLSRWFCGRCFGAVLHETLHVPYAEPYIEKKPARFGYRRGVRLLDLLLKEHGKHYQENTVGRGNFMYRVENYLRDYCGAPDCCFDADAWPEGIKPGDVIRRALELNHDKPRAHAKSRKKI